ncbi:hypothetical protein CPB86DRAFT_816656 [Serendipita vermifera]|nr:hypothetical protein CPB86DRAFT_816656 [Serendipita vermifera]
MATARPRVTSRTPKRPKLNTGGDESNWNDLVNFQLPPRRHNFTTPRRNKKASTNTPWAKERFINSAYRFVLRPSVTADYTVHFADPDIYFQWTDIVQILVPHTGASITGEGNSMCPICLGAPIAPRMTKCGHVYCYGCILHYFQTSENRGWHRCPICFDSISESGLKPVKWLYGMEKEATGGGTLTMRLMLRPQLTTLALPQSATWPSDLIPPHQAAFQFLPDIYNFAKFMIPTPESLQRDFHMEVDALKIDRDEKLNVADGLGASFVEGAITKVYLLIEDIKALDVPSLQDAISAAKKGVDHILALAEQRSDQARFSDFSPQTAVDSRPEDWPERQEHLREAASTPTKQLKARKNVNPPPPSTSNYYFYQAASGSLTFLHPLDIRILLSHFGSYANFPPTIEVKVEARNEGTVDDDLRKRCKYLAHLPEAADVTFVEANLESVVGKDAMAAFEGALKSRRSRRKEKERRDDRAKIRAEEKEKERLADEYWTLKFSAARSQTTTTSRDDEELQAFLRGMDLNNGPNAAESAPQPTVQGAWGERSFASTLSAPATGTPCELMIDCQFYSRKISKFVVHTYLSVSPIHNLLGHLANTIKDRPRTNQLPPRDADQWNMDIAWHELEQARTAANAGSGNKKKAPKLVLSLNGGGAPTGRRR